MLISIGFGKFEGDQCLFYIKGAKNIVVILIYVDDSIMIGERSDLDRVVVAIRKCGLTLSVEGKLNNCVGCSIPRANESGFCNHSLFTS